MIASWGLSTIKTWAAARPFTVTSMIVSCSFTKMGTWSGALSRTVISMDAALGLSNFRKTNVANQSTVSS